MRAEVTPHPVPARADNHSTESDGISVNQHVYILLIKENKINKRQVLEPPQNILEKNLKIFQPISKYKSKCSSLISSMLLMI